LAIDFGVVALSALLFKFDNFGESKEGSDGTGVVDLAMSRLTKDQMADKEQDLRRLLVDVPVGVGGTETRRASVAELQDGARQNVVIVAGPKTILRDALVKAMIVGDKFAKQNILVVPYSLEPETDTKGFGKRAWEEKGYVAKPSEGASERAAWSAYVDGELAAAAAQARQPLAELEAQGIVIVASRDGKIVRRGLGVPAWEMVVADLAPKIPAASS
jgi:hypothetical protein